MTAKVVDFAQVRQSKGDKPPANIVPSKPTKLKTEFEIFQDVFDEVVADWQSYASKNRLNEYIASKIPPKAKLDSSTDYFNDLNAISKVEQKLDIKSVIFCPTVTMTNPYGWMVSFHVGKQVYSTSPDMATESAARAFAVLLFLKFTRTLDSLGRSIS